MSSNLRRSNCKPSQIKRILLEKFNKQISIQKLKNVLAKTPGEDQDDNIDFEEFFEEFENEGGDVDWQEDPDGTVRCMTFSSNKMKNAFKSSDAPLVQLDTTFDMEKARYKVLAVVYLNPATNKSEVAFMALLCDESKPNVEFALQTFKKICLRYDLIFIVDKDFGQLEVLNSVFPTALVLLCVFHVIKFMKSLIASAPVVVDVKKDLLLQFRRIIYANSEDIFKTEDQKFVELAAGVTVKAGDKQVSLVEYYIRNWRSVSPMWVRYHRKNLPSLGDNTSNRVEWTFWTLKKSIQDTFVTLPETAKAAVYLIKFCVMRLEEQYNIHDANDNIKKLNLAASQHLNDRGCTIFHHAQKILEEKLNNLQKVDGGVREQFTKGSRCYQTTGTSCTCTIAQTHQAPCAHILFLRSQDEDQSEIFSVELFHPRYHRPTSSLISVLENQATETEPRLQNYYDVAVNEEDGFEPEDEEPDVVLSDRQKHSMVMPVLMRIGNLISCHPTKKFFEYLDALNELEKRVRRGQNFMMQLHNILSTVFNEDDHPEVDDVNEPVDDIVGAFEEDVNQNTITDFNEVGGEHSPGDDSQDTVKQSGTMK